MDLAELIERERQRFGVPGVAVAVVNDGAVELIESFGQRDVDADLPVTDHTLFAIASCTKAFTTALIGMLVRDGLVEWDKPVREYLPYFRLHDPVASELATVRDLLSHRTGLPRHDVVWYGNPRLDRREVVAQRLRHLPLSKGIRESYQYNNLMFMTAGLLAGEVLGSTWEDAIRAKLFEPLGMSASRFSPAEASATPDWSHAYRKNAGTTEELPRKDFPVCGPAGSIYSCTADMAKWLSFTVDETSRDIVQETWKPVIPTGEESPWPEVFSVGYAMGWVVESHRGQRVLQHGGSIDGFGSQVAIIPEKRLGLAVLTNLDGSSLPSVLMRAILDHALDLEPIGWGQRLYARETSVRESVTDAQSRAVEAAHPAAHPESEYSGRYEHPGYGVAEVDIENRLMRLGEAELTLRHRTFETWDATLARHEITRSMTFVADPNGALTAFEIALEPTVAPIRFSRVIDPALSRDEVLAEYAGDYRIGEITALIRANDGKLETIVDGDIYTQLRPHRVDVFSIVGIDAQWVRFIRVDGVITEAVVEPGGLVLRRAEPE
jgi:CubicO group peptidase (beta-lactamase class C family)